MDILEQYLNLPDSCMAGKRMPKKAFIENPEFDLRKEEKETLKEYIKSIYWQYSLKEDTLNIPTFENEEVRYEEIQIFVVNVNEKSKEDKVCNLIQKYIPYPIIILLECDEFIKFNIAIKKINKVEREKLFIEEMIYTEWINTDELNQKEKDFLECLDINKFTTNNLFDVFKGYKNSIDSFNLSKYRESFEVKSVENTSNDMELLEKITTIENEIVGLRSKIKKESNMGAKVELNVKIKKLQKQINDIKSSLN